MCTLNLFLICKAASSALPLNIINRQPLILSMLKLLNGEAIAAIWGYREMDQSKSLLLVQLGRVGAVGGRPR